MTHVEPGTRSEIDSGHGEGQHIVFVDRVMQPSDGAENCVSGEKSSLLSSHHRIGHLGPSRQDWRTPPALFEALNREFRFNLDGAADEDSALCSRYYTEYSDALKQPWHRDSGGGAIFLNPPYAKLGPWVEKAYQESRKGATVVMLLPASTGARWFHEVVQPHAEIRFLQGRLKFEGAKHPATFDSMVIVFRPWRVQV